MFVKICWRLTNSTDPSQKATVYEERMKKMMTKSLHRAEIDLFFARKRHKVVILLPKCKSVQLSVYVRDGLSSIKDDSNIT